MGKLVMVVSAGITAFILALTAGAVYAYRTLSSSAAPTPQPISQVGAPLQLAALPTPTDVPNVSPQDAAAIAAKSLNRTDLYSVELSDWQGTQTYKVTFSSGDIVYVGLTGQVLASVVPTPVPALPQVVTSVGGGGGGGHGGGGEVEHEHEGGGE